MGELQLCSAAFPVAVTPPTDRGMCHAAAEMISTFLKSSSHNLKYVGIDGLARIVRINPKYAAEHQLAVIDCLEDPDDMLKKKTLELLYKMTKPNNVEVGCTFPLQWSAELTCSSSNCCVGVCSWFERL